MAEPGGGHLLVVDDNRVTRMILGRSLELQGHRVVYAENGRQALEQMRSQRFEMVLLDIEMPEMDGYQVLEQVMADPQLNDIPIIVTSALEEIESVVRCIQMGAEDYLTKPVNEVLLRARVNASLEKKRLRDMQAGHLRRLEREMEIARQTQKSILPEVLPERPGYDFGALMVPAQAVGGDFYEFIELNHRQLGIVIGDVSDKGLPAALFMALTYSLVRAEARRFATPGQVLEAVNRSLLEMNAAGLFVTLIYAVLDFSTGRLEYARAGHPLPVVVNQDGTALEIPLKPGQPVGLFEEILLDVHSFSIPPGGMVLFYSDGLTEAINPAGSEFGQTRLLAACAGHAGQPAQAMCEQLWQALQVHSGELVHQDDFSVVAIKRV